MDVQFQRFNGAMILFFQGIGLSVRIYVGTDSRATNKNFVSSMGTLPNFLRHGAPELR